MVEGRWRGWCEGEEGSLERTTCEGAQDCSNSIIQAVKAVWQMDGQW